MVFRDSGWELRYCKCSQGFGLRLLGQPVRRRDLADLLFRLSLRPANLLTSFAWLNVNAAE